MSRSRGLLVAAWCAAAVVLAGRGPAQAQGAVRAIITFRADVDRDAYTESAVRGAGGTPIRHLHLVHAVVAYVTPAQALGLRRRGDVERVEEDARVQALGQVTPWGVAWIHSPQAWPTDRGEGIRVGVLDSGIDLTHPDLVGAVHGGYNCLSPGSSYNDDYGHGSHVAGTIGARLNTIGVVGVAPGVWLYAVKALDATGSGYTSDLITGLDWCINNRIQVVNMSLGLSQDVQAFHTAVTQAYNDGIVLVAAAGNTSGATIYPAAYAQCLSVSATNQTDALASFSSYGKVDLAAPGVNIRSCWLGGGYTVESGTSMSTAHVTGVVALLLHKHPGLTPAQVEADLKAEATPLGSSYYYGAGEVNAYRAAQ